MPLGSYPQTATYWAYSGNDGYGGRSFSSPIAIDVRWQDVNEKYINGNGEEVVSRSKIFLKQDVTIGSYLYLGTSTENSPYDQSGAFEIQAFSKIINIKGNDYERKAML